MTRRWSEQELRARGLMGESSGAAGSKIQKYRNRIVKAEGRTFRSQLEFRRYRDLRLMEKAFAITGLECQPRFSIDVAGVHICDYVADFAYWRDGVKVIEDCKGAKTLLYRAKKALMQAVHGIEVQEITS